MQILPKLTDLSKKLKKKSDTINKSNDSRIVKKKEKHKKYVNRKKHGTNS